MRPDRHPFPFILAIVLALGSGMSCQTVPREIPETLLDCGPKLAPSHLDLDEQERPKRLQTDTNRDSVYDETIAL